MTAAGEIFEPGAPTSVFNGMLSESVIHLNEVHEEIYIERGR